MDPITGGLISGGIGAISSIFNTSANNNNAQQLQAQQEAYNTQMVQQQQAYETQMSNTAYQRQTADMRAAGLNPILAAGGGGGASTPSSSVPSISPQARSSAAGGVGDALSKIIPTAMALKTANAELDKTVAATADLKTAAKLKEAQTDTELERPANVAKDTREKVSRGSYIDSETAIRNQQLKDAINKGITSSNESGINPTVRKVLDVAGFAGRKGAEIVSPVSNLTNSALKVKQSFEDRWP